MKLFVPITKIDEEKRLVYGRAAQEILDRSGEIMDYESSKPLFEKWSSETQDASMGKSYGNVRVMHSTVVAGKLAEPIVFDDAEKAIDVVAKVIDDDQWKMVQEGGFTGFSIGGKYAKRWQDGVVTRYTAEPNELSLVDRPCIPTATFQVVKVDGSTETKGFKQPESSEDEDKLTDEIAKMVHDGQITLARIVELAKASIEPKAEPKRPAEQNAETEARAREICKADTGAEDGWMGYVGPALRDLAKAKDKPYGDVAYADAKNSKYPIDTEEHIRAAWSYINQEKNQADYSSEEVDSIKAKIVAAWKKKIDKEGPPSAEKCDDASDGATKSDLAQLLRKYAGEEIYDASAALRSLADIYYLFSKESAEPMEPPEQVAALKQAVEALRTYIASEIMEDKSTPQTMMLADEAGEMQKYAVKADAEVGEAFVKVFDGMQLEKAAAAAQLMKVELALVKVGARNSKEDMARVQKMHDTAVELGATCQKEGVKSDEPGELQKSNIDLKKSLDEALARIKALEDQPLPAKGAKLVVVGKEEDGVTKADEPEIKSTPGQHNPEAAHALIKAAIRGAHGLSK